MKETQEQRWQLKSVKGCERGRSDATLCSKLLDPFLHPSRSVRVSVAGAAAKNPPGYALDAFVRRSIDDYVDSQNRVRTALGSGLAADRAESGFKPLDAAEKIWDEAQVQMVAFEKKRVPTPEGLANMKRLMPKINLKRLREAADKPDTKMRFTMMLNVAWDGEHARLATFRDGELVSIEYY